MAYSGGISRFVCAAIVFVLSAIPAQAHVARTTRLLQALANSQGGKAVVTVGALPPGGVAGMPLPGGPVLGSVSSAPNAALASFGPASTIDVFYEVPDAQVAGARYEALLEGRGWKMQQPFGMGGFTMSASAKAKSYCGKGDRYVTVRALQGDPGVLVVSIVRQNLRALIDLCAAGSPLTRIETELRSPLPDLRPPDGVDMATPFPPMNPFGSSSAYLHTSKPLGEMLAAFSAQLVKAGWIAGPDVVGADVAAETLRYGKPGQPRWRAVLTVSRSGKGVEYANISAVREANE